MGNQGNLASTLDKSNFKKYFYTYVTELINFMK